MASAARRRLGAWYRRGNRWYMRAGHWELLEQLHDRLDELTVENARALIRVLDTTIAPQRRNGGAR